MDGVTTVERMSADDFLAMPEDRVRRQLIDGEPVVTEPTWEHNQAQIAIAFALREWSGAQQSRGVAGLPLDVKVDERNVYGPDVVWYRKGRSPQRGDRPPYALPDLAVEVRSPSTWRYDVGAKKTNYERRGVAELWLVDTAADVVLVFRRSSPEAPTFDVSEEFDSDSTLTSPLLPGFALRVATVFGD